MLGRTTKHSETHHGAKEHLLALDQGTSSSRAIVFHASGRIVAMAQREFRQIYPQPGWVEHDANEIWDTQLAVAREALAKANLKAGDIAAIGITNQRETTLLWNRRERHADPPRHRLAGPAHRAAVCATARARGLRRSGAALHRPGDRPVLLGHQDPLAARQREPARTSTPRTARSPSAPSTRGCCGSSPAAACTPPTSATRRARCCSTSATTCGTASC